MHVSKRMRRFLHLHAERVEPMVARATIEPPCEAKVRSDAAKTSGEMIPPLPRLDGFRDSRIGHSLGAYNRWNGH